MKRSVRAEKVLFFTSYIDFDQQNLTSSFHVDLSAKFKQSPSRRSRDSEEQDGWTENLHLLPA